MSSLKAFTPKLAALLGTPPIALYERQRALVRAGLLELSAGRGPGSGVRLTPRAVAMLLISVLVTGSLSDSVERTLETAEAVPDAGKCALTGKGTFLDALIAVIGGQVPIERVGKVSVSRTSVHAELGHNFATAKTKFSGPATREKGMQNWTYLKASVMRSIIESVRAMTSLEDTNPKADPTKRRNPTRRARGK